eukprot:10298094-Prorocentrum_lima.AAC.1
MICLLVRARPGDPASGVVAVGHRYEPHIFCQHSPSAKIEWSGAAASRAGPLSLWRDIWCSRGMRKR